MALNDDIQDDILAHTVDLSRLSESVRNKVLAHLKLLEDDLAKQLEEADLAGLAPSRAVSRQEAVIRQTRATINRAYDSMSTTLDGELTDVAGYHQGALVDVLNHNIGASVVDVALTPKDLEVLVSDTLIRGAPSSDWWAKQSSDLQNRFATEVRLGVSQGETNDQIVQRVRGKFTGRWREIEVDGETQKVREFAGGIMPISTRDATSLVRTSVQAVSNEVNSQVYQENQDVLKGVVEIATLDSRTTPFCRQIDGCAWDFDGNPLPESRQNRPYPGHPPYHWQCRTIEGPVTKSWEELIKENGGTVPDGLEEIDPGTRSSMDGQVPAGMNYEEWLKGKPEAFQKDVLGQGKWKLWNDGKLTMADMVDFSGRPLTLAELQGKASPSTAQQYKDRVKDLIAGQKKSVREAADMLGLSFTRVNNVAKDLGLAKGAKPKPVPIPDVPALLTAQKREEAVRLLNDPNNKLSLAEIGEKFGVDGDKVFQCFKEWRADLTQRMLTADGDSLVDMLKQRNARDLAEVKSLKAKMEDLEKKVQAYDGTQEDFDKIIVQHIEAGQSYENKRAELKKALLSDIQVAEGSRAKIFPIYNKGVTPTMELRAVKAEEFLESVTSNDVVLAHRVQVNNIGNERAYALPGSVHLAESDTIGIYVHELGHTYEFYDNDILTKSKEFLKRRIGSDPLRKLVDINPYAKYGPEEEAWEDKFLDPYAGKYYPHATETLSMGLQWLYEDPVRLLTEDEDYFRFVTRQLRGK